MHTSPPSPHPTIKEHAAKLDYLDFSKCAAVQRLASNCVKEIAKSNCCPEVMPPAWIYTSAMDRAIVWRLRQRQRAVVQASRGADFRADSQAQRQRLPVPEAARRGRLRARQGRRGGRADARAQASQNWASLRVPGRPDMLVGRRGWRWGEGGGWVGGWVGVWERGGGMQ